MEVIYLKKKLFIFLSIISVAFASVVPVYAQKDYSSSTGWKNAPALTPGVRVNTVTYNLTSESHTSVNADLVAVYYDNYNSLSDNFASDSNRILWIDLYEDDVEPNADDLVKTYKGTFKGRRLDTIVLYEVVEQGNIDSAGDPDVELYLSILLNKVSGDKSLPTSTPLFEYNMSVY